MITRIALLACMAHATAYGSDNPPEADSLPASRDPRSALDQSTGTGVGSQNICRYRHSRWIGGHVNRPTNLRKHPSSSNWYPGRRKDSMSGVLGYAMPYQGRHIIIFFDRIETMQDALSTVLGHVMVHEITHVIQGVSRHSDTGLMKPHWTHSRSYRKCGTSRFPSPRRT